MGRDGKRLHRQGGGPHGSHAAAGPGLQRRAAGGPPVHTVHPHAALTAGADGGEHQAGAAQVAVGIQPLGGGGPQAAHQRPGDQQAHKADQRKHGKLHQQRSAQPAGGQAAHRAHGKPDGDQIDGQALRRKQGHSGGQPEQQGWGH